MNPLRPLCLLSLFACTGPTSPEVVEVPLDPVVWPEPTESLCGVDSSVIQMAVRLPADSALAGSRGDVVVALMHRRFGDPDNGGHPHWSWQFPDQPLSATTATVLEVDMCEGNAIMWSEENCEYNLVVLVDRDGNNTREGRLARPNRDEPAALEVFNQSCAHEGPYRFEMTLDCLEGSECVRFEPPGDCDCDPNSCESESAICEL